jgi:hypothetical protein
MPVVHKLWTSDDLKVLRRELIAQRDLRDVAAVLDRPVEEVEGMARDLGWIESPPGCARESGTTCVVLS